jgi:HAE1 family hydrophobic/amphiphilic exporter-1
MLFDDAICVIENIYRHVETGRERREAAHAATREIGLAVVATTAALGAVFVPIAFMGGVAGRFFREFGLVVACAVGASTLVALTLTPMLCSRTLRAPAPGEARPLAAALERVWLGLEASYRRLLRLALGRRRTVVAIALGATLAGCGFAWLVPVDFVPPSDRSEFTVWLQLAPGSPLERTAALAGRVEKALLDDPRVRVVFSTIGGDLQQRGNEAEIYVQIAPRAERDATQLEVMDDVRARLAALGPPLRDYAVEDIPWISLRGQRNFQLGYSLRGSDSEGLAAAAERLAARMREAGGYVDVTSSFEAGKPELVLEVARDRAADLGISAAQIGRTVSGLLAGFEAARFEQGGESYDVRVQLAPRWRDDPRELSLVKVRAPSGELVPLSALVTPRRYEGPVEVRREDRSRVVTVSANLRGKPLGVADREVSGFVRELDLPDGTEVVPVGQTENMQESLRAIAFAFVLALVATYMILAAQFDSFVHPFTIMLSAPLSFCGAFAALLVSGQTLGMMSQIGFLMLMGLVMKNGILLVDYTNTLRAAGRDLHAAALEAGPTRLRPVLMTTISTVFGMLPMALASGDGAEWRSAMAVISIGGLVASMLLTLVVVPVAYTLVDDAQGEALRLGRAARARLLERLARRAASRA